MANNSMAVNTFINLFVLLQIILQILNTKQNNYNNIYQVELFIMFAVFKLGKALYINKLVIMYVHVNIPKILFGPFTRVL